MLDWIKEGKVGDWSVEHFKISKTEAALYLISCYGSYEIPPAPGEYTRLMHKKRGLIMSDTRQELFDLYDFIKSVKQYRTRLIHINGLGLGIFAKAALDLGCCVQVIEIDPDVVELVGSQISPLFPDTLEIIQADALEWKPPKGLTFGVVWHDIWDVASIDNWEEYKLLMRRYGRKTSWQGAWARERLLREKRSEYYSLW